MFLKVINIENRSLIHFLLFSFVLFCVFWNIANSDWILFWGFLSRFFSLSRLLKNQTLNWLPFIFCMARLLVVSRVTSDFFFQTPFPSCPVSPPFRISKLYPVLNYIYSLPHIPSLTFSFLSTLKSNVHLISSALKHLDFQTEKTSTLWPSHGILVFCFLLDFILLISVYVGLSLYTPWGQGRSVFIVTLQTSCAFLTSWLIDRRRLCLCSCTAGIRWKSKHALGCTQNL